MDFGSKYVFKYSDSEEESVSDDEFETGLDSDVLPIDGNPSLPEVVVQSADNDSVETDVGRGRTLYASRLDSCAPPILPARAFSAAAAAPAAKKKTHHWFSKGGAKKEAKASALEVHVASDLGGGGGDKREHRSERDWARGGMVNAKKWRRADTNVIAIKFDHLLSPSNMHTGDPVVCEGCQAMLSHISSLKDEGDDKVWTCEFCEARNVVDVAPEEIPSELDVTYMLEPAPLTTASGRQGADESLVVFCVDVSGSMCVSKEVPGRLTLRGSHTERLRGLNTEGEDQWMPRQNRNVTYITRLQGLQAAVDHQLGQLAADHPTRRAALISFNSEVTVVGDGRGAPVMVGGDKLLNQEELMDIGSKLALPVCVKDSRATLGNKVFELEEGGQTALGPAMLVSVALACQVPGSKVIMCTDGLANVGVGNLDKADQPAEYEQATAFYRSVAEIAKDKGVSVSILTIAGTDCKLVELGGVANITSGQVNIVDPLKLTQEFGNILANPIIASRVMATFFVHKGLYIRGEAERTSRVVREVGNVTKESEVTFEYGVRSGHGKKRAAAPPPPGDAAQKDSASTSADAAAADAPMSKDAAAPLAAEETSAAAATSSSTPAATDEAAASDRKSSAPGDQLALPFQVQIRYTDLDGAQAMRVLTQTKPVTSEREQAENYMNMPVVGAHAAKQSSRFALDGEYTPSRLNAFMYQRLFARQAATQEGAEGYQFYNQVMAPFDRQLLQAQTVEARATGSSVSRYEGLDMDVDEGLSGSSNARYHRLVSRDSPQAWARPAASEPAARRATCSDTTANQIYSHANVSSKAFKKPPPS